MSGDPGTWVGMTNIRWCKAAGGIIPIPVLQLHMISVQKEHAMSHAKSAAEKAEAKAEEKEAAEQAKVEPEADPDRWHFTKGTVGDLMDHIKAWVRWHAKFGKD